MDLAEAGVAGKERDRRFLERVFTAAERAQILDAMAPTLALWKTWAAKEAAYKVACKIREKVIFAHHAFEVVMERHEGLVRFEDLVVRVRWELQREYVHCVGQLVPDHADASRPRGLPPENGSRHHFLSAVAHALQPLDGSLTTAERASVHSLASERARLLARKITEQWGLGSAEIIRRWRTWGWSAPVLAREGRRVEGFDVSLSHDGRYVAAAVAGPRWPV